MSQIKITSFFTKINQQSTNQQSDKQNTADCEENNNKNVNYDSDITDIYDYEGDIAVLDDKINEKETKKKEKNDEIVCNDDDNNKKELNDEQQQVQVVRRGRGRPRKIKVEIKVQSTKASSSSSNSEEENKNESTTKKRLKSDVKDGNDKCDGKQDESAIVNENKGLIKLNSTNSSFHKLWAKTDQPKSGENILTEQVEKNKKKEKKNEISTKDTTNEKESNNGQVVRRGRGRPRKVKVELIKSSSSNSEDDSEKVPKAKKILKSIDKPMNGKDSKNNDKHNESVILAEEKAPKILKSDLNGKEKSDKQDETSESKCPVKSNSTNSFLKQWVKTHQPKSGEDLTEQVEKKKKEKKNDIVKDDKKDSNSGQVEHRGRGRPRKVKVELIKSSSSSNSEEDSGEKAPKAKKILKNDKPINGKNDKQNESVILIEDTSPVKPPVIPIPLPTHSYLKLWTETHQPKSSVDLIGHSVQVETFKQWLCVWHETFNNASNSDSDSDEDNSSAQGFIDGKCFYIHGQNGVGKTSLVFTVASELGYKVLEYNATAQRFTPTLIQKELSHSLQSYYINNQQQPQKGSVFSLFNQKKNAPTVEQSKVKLSKSLILIDDLDGIIYENANYTELWRSLKQMIADARKPIVFTSSYEANFLCCNEQHYFTAVKLDSIAKLSVGQLLNRVSFRQKDEEQNESTEIVDRFENLFSMNIFDGDARKLLNHAQFWHYGNDADDDKPVDNVTSTKPEDSKLSVYNLSTNVALLDFLSLEDIYQTEFDQLWVECTDFDERAYNSYLYDNRMSLLFTNSESPIINRAQSNLTNSFDDTLKSNSTLTEQQTSMQSICQLLRDHYLQLDSKQSGLFSDCFAFFGELSAMHPAVIEEIQCSKQSANSSTINSATRSKRRSKASCAFAYL